MKDFITPPNYMHFNAKKLFETLEESIDDITVIMSFCKRDICFLINIIKKVVSMFIKNYSY